MADNKTSWILELTDKITGPIKKVMESVGKTGKAVDEFNESANTKVPLQSVDELGKEYSRVNSELDAAVSKLHKLKEDYGKLANDYQRRSASQGIEDQKQKIKELASELDNVKTSIDKATKGFSFQTIKTDLKSVTSGIKNAISSLFRFSNANKDSAAQIKSNLDIAKREYSRLGAEIIKARQQVEIWKKEDTPFNRAHLVLYEEKLEHLQKAHKEVAEEVERLDKNLKNVGRRNFAEVIVSVNQLSEVIGKVSRGLQFAVDYKSLEKDVRQLTDLTGDSLSAYVAKSRELATVYEQNEKQVARTAHTMTSQLGGTYESNFELLEEGFKRGADLSGSLLSNMDKYSGAFTAMGISAKDAMTIMAKAEKEGFDGDRAIQSIIRAGEKISELEPRQKAVLEQLGVGVEDLAGKTAWEATQIVAKSMKGMTEQAKAQTLSRIFGKAGKDSGLAFVTGLAEEIPDLSELPEIEESTSGFKRLFSQISSWGGQAFGNFAMWAQQVTPLVTTIAGAIPIIEMLTKVTGLQTIATRLLGITILGTPIGWIAAIIGVLIGAVILCWENFEGFRKAVYQGWEVLKLFGKVIKDYVIGRIKGLLSGITGLGSALVLFFKGKWSEAADAAKKGVLDLMGTTAGAEAAEQFTEGYYDALGEGAKKHELNEAERKKKKDTSAFNVNEYIQGNAEGLSFEKEDESTAGKKSKAGAGSKSGSGLSIAGRGGGASIIMTINNYFNVSPGTNTRKLADEVAGIIGDRLEDSLVAV